MTSSIFSLATPESLTQFSQGLMVLLINASVKDSSLERVKVILQCLGPLLSAVKYGKLISVCAADESSILAFSDASRTRYKAILSLETSMPVYYLNSLMT
jgi:hypothetical protein